MNREEIESKLREFILTELILNADYPLTADEPLVTAGLIDSLSLAQIGVFAEVEFDMYIPDPDLTVEKMNTLAQMVDRILQG